MEIEDILGKVIAYNSRTRNDFNDYLSQICESAVIGFGNLVRPIAEPSRLLIDRIYFNPEEIWS